MLVFGPKTVLHASSLSRPNCVTPEAERPKESSEHPHEPSDLGRLLSHFSAILP